MQSSGRKLGLVETLKQTQLEEKMTKKGNTMSKVAGQQNEINQNKVEKSKTKEGTGNGRRNKNKKGENKNMGYEQHGQMGQACFGNFMEQPGSSVSGTYKKEHENSVNYKYNMYMCRNTCFHNIC